MTTFYLLTEGGYGYLVEKNTGNLHGEQYRDHSGPNYLALTIWSMDSQPFQLAGLQLQADAAIQSGYIKPDLVQGLRYLYREIGWLFNGLGHLGPG